MRTVWLYISSYLPFVVETRRGAWEAGKNAFDLGRDYERAVQQGKIK